jgi:transposase
LQAAALFARDVPVAQIAGRLRVSHNAVYVWRRRWLADREAGLVSKGPSGTECRLSPVQLETLTAALQEGPAAHGFVEDQRWTLERIVDLIVRRFRVRYTLRGVSMLLHRIGFKLGVARGQRQSYRRRCKACPRKRVVLSEERRLDELAVFGRSHRRTGEQTSRVRSDHGEGVARPVIVLAEERVEPGEAVGDRIVSATGRSSTPSAVRTMRTTPNDAPTVSIWICAASASPARPATATTAATGTGWSCRCWSPCTSSRHPPGQLGVWDWLHAEGATTTDVAPATISTVADILAPVFPAVAEMLHEAKADLTAFADIPTSHWRTRRRDPHRAARRMAGQRPTLPVRGVHGRTRRAGNPKWTRWQETKWRKENSPHRDLTAGRADVEFTPLYGTSSSRRSPGSRPTRSSGFAGFDEQLAVVAPDVVPHNQESRRGIRTPAARRPCVGLSAYTAPIVQPPDL